MKTDSINIIQITDTHVFATDAGRLEGYATNQFFNQAIEKITSQNKQTDFIFLTGDISQDRSVESYEYAAARLNQLNVPVYWIVGNHDAASATVQSVFSRYQNMHALQHLATPYWDFVALNTRREGTDNGYVEPDEMERFVARLNMVNKSQKQVAVIMHHHPVPVGTPLVDDCMLQDSEDLLKIVKGRSEIKLIICGHVHGDYQIDVSGKKLETCPATSFQWKKRASTNETENERAIKYFSFEQNSYQSSVVYF